MTYSQVLAKLLRKDIFFLGCFRSVFEVGVVGVD